MTSPGEIPPECPTCGKRQWPVIHSCRGIPAARPAEPTDELREALQRVRGAMDVMAYRAERAGTGAEEDALDDALTLLLAALRGDA